MQLTLGRPSNRCPFCPLPLSVGLLATNGTHTAHYRCVSDFLERALPSQSARRPRGG